MRHLQSLCWGIFEPCICCTAIRSHLEMVSTKSHPQLGLRHIIFQPLLHRDVSSCPGCSVAPVLEGKVSPTSSSHPWQSVNPQHHWCDLGEAGKLECSTFLKTQFVFHLSKLIFSVFLPPFKCQINIRFKKKNKKAAFLFFLWVIIHMGSLPRSPFNLQIPMCCTISFPWERTRTCSLLAKLKSAKINLVPRHWQLGIKGI